MAESVLLSQAARDRIVAEHQELVAKVASAPAGTEPDDDAVRAARLADILENGTVVDPADPPQDSVPLSLEAYERIYIEHLDLTTRGKIDIARKIETARELGDLSENGDYHAAKEEQGKMAGRINHLANLLGNGIITESTSSTTVQAGAVVGLRYEGDTDVERYLLGSIEERVEGVEVMSPGSALGQALVGHAVGDTVEYETPTGAKLKVEIVSVGG
ncbi:transcription elongation factor GreA [Aquihabitans sp. G128]|uniref:GreA/GreB family elongation factor n=1 Tax=Aquihabitans sp. G128 TaxID=2849779 RepID=UPI001C244A8C|nr:transcription elongation factor GreA [Aquihabitans sp. G128]QXC63073.1 transcription elongation factor GreA [Aquihabitans sp. G128]